MERPNFEIDHVAYTVSDLERSERWYGEIFGAQTLVKFERDDLMVRGALLKIGSSKLEIFQPYDPIPLAEYRLSLETSLPHIGPQHLALRVSDFDRTLEYLVAKNVELAGEPTVGKTAKYVFCKDPDGSLIEIKQDL